MKKFILALFIIAVILSFGIIAYADDTECSVSSQEFMLNGEPVEISKYNINGKNYVKLRDVAYILNGTESQFDIVWDYRTNTANIITGMAYMRLSGNELQIDEDMSDTAMPTRQTILVNDEEIDNTPVYNIGGNNYFELDTLHNIFNFDLSYRDKSNTVFINSQLLIQSRTQEEIIEEDHIMESYRYESEDFKMDYWLYNPNTNPDNQQMPLIVYLHSGNGTSNDIDVLVKREYSMCQYIYEGETFPNAIVLMPQSPNGWTAHLDQLMELIEYIVDEYSIDTNRIYITGVSRGGCATFDMLVKYPDYFAAGMPIASAVNPYGPAQYIKTPIRIYHGRGDLANTNGETTMGNSVQYIEPLINQNGGQCELFILEGVGHGGQHVYKDTENFDAMEWLLSQIKLDDEEDITDKEES